MQLRSTIFVISKDDNSVCRIEIYTDNDVPFPGYWNIETNRLLLSPEAYSSFKDLKSQKEQKTFFDSLQKVSNMVLSFG